MFTKKILRKILLCAVVMIGLIPNQLSMAYQGDMGYEGGISAGQQTGKTAVAYTEVVFVSGEPIEMTGTVTIKKGLKKNASGQSTLTTSYLYVLKNLQKAATLNRNIVYSKLLDQKDNRQVVETSTLSGTPTESIKIGTKTYTLSSIESTGSNLVDPKPGIEYYAGDFMWKKKYAVSNGNGSAGTVTLDTIGNFVGFNEHWGRVETVKYSMKIYAEEKKNDKIDRWQGSADVRAAYQKNFSLRYQGNEPTAISFSGGYLKEWKSQSLLEYNCKIPEFDTQGVSTYNMVDKSGTSSLDVFPATERLKVTDSTKFRGHWAQKDIEQLTGLEIFNYDMGMFDPEEFMNRGEFADALVKTAREVPPDPVFLTGANKAPAKTATKKGSAKETIFSDVYDTHPYLESIESAFKRGMISGRGNGTFAPDDSITVADAITILIRTLGLEQVAQWPGNVTVFKDNNEIPAYARDHVFAATKIGLIRGDPNGWIRPNERISKARAAAMLNRFLDFMRAQLIQEYTEKLMRF